MSGAALSPTTTMNRIGQRIGQAIRQEAAIWRIAALPGLAVIAFVIGLRFAGLLQGLELVALDLMLRFRPDEGPDDRILIVGIDEADIRDAGTYPIPDAALATLIQTLQQQQPAALGLDIVRDLPVGSGHEALVQVFQTSSSLIGIETVLPDAGGLTIDPPPTLPPEQIGFVDTLVDLDGYVRRSLLATPDVQGKYHFSLTFRLAETYLTRQGIAAGNGSRDPNAIRFGTTELMRVKPNTGGYVRTDANGNQVLINVRSGPAPFRIVSMADVTAGEVPEDWIRDRVVLIGIMSQSAKDLVNSRALTGRTSHLIYGVELQAHAVSQIISAVLDQRPLLRDWTDLWEYGWIIGWGLLGIGLARLIRSPFALLVALGITSVILVGLSFGLLLQGWWVPVAPALLVLLLNGAGLTAALFYRHEQNLKARILDRQLVIDQAFDAIHNGPLQTLAGMLRSTQDRGMTDDPLYTDLKQLNQELRAVYESVRREALSQGNRFQVSSDLELDLNSPFHEVLYAVYRDTLARNFPGFQTLKLTLPSFEEMDVQSLSQDQKKGVCRFLEEALCNVGKHAVGATRLEIICKQENGENIIRVIDNGNPSQLPPTDHSVQPLATVKTGGQGTKQAEALARQLGGHFRRFPNALQGTVCELTWPVLRPGFWRF